MDDLISRAELFNRLATVQTLGEAYAVIQDLPSAQPEQRWIPCSERLPEEDGTYIVYAPGYMGGSSSAKEHHNGVMFSKLKKGKWSVEHGYYSRPECVKAWMPLPEPVRLESDQWEK